jgi:hypothetical protein
MRIGRALSAAKAGVMASSNASAWTAPVPREGAPVYEFSGNNHCLYSSRLNRWIGFVSTIPRTLDNRRRSPERHLANNGGSQHQTKHPLSRVVALNALIENKKLHSFYVLAIAFNLSFYRESARYVPAPSYCRRGNLISRAESFR